MSRQQPDDNSDKAQMQIVVDLVNAFSSQVRKEVVHYFDMIEHTRLRHRAAVAAIIGVLMYEVIVLWMTIAGNVSPKKHRDALIRILDTALEKHSAEQKGDDDG